MEQRTHEFILTEGRVADLMCQTLEVLSDKNQLPEPDVSTYQSKHPYHQLISRFDETINWLIRKALYRVSEALKSVRSILKKLPSNQTGYNQLIEAALNRVAWELDRIPRPLAVASY